MIILYTKWKLTTLCDRLFQLAYLTSYRVMVCEFLPLFEFAPRPADQPEELDDPKDPLFAVHSGLNTVEETDTPSTPRVSMSYPVQHLSGSGK
ncbi:hypothetical protein Hanom_Chr14g01277051 [Helianthus anomalus]